MITWPRARNAGGSKPEFMFVSELEDQILTLNNQNKFHVVKVFPTESLKTWHLEKGLRLLLPGWYYVVIKQPTDKGVIAPWLSGCQEVNDGTKLDLKHSQNKNKPCLELSNGILLRSRTHTLLLLFTNAKRQRVRTLKSHFGVTSRQQATVNWCKN